MSENMKERVADICAGIVSLVVAFWIKGPGWTVQNVLICLAVMAVTYIVVRLFIMLPGIVRTVRERKEE